MRKEEIIFLVGHVTWHFVSQEIEILEMVETMMRDILIDIHISAQKKGKA